MKIKTFAASETGAVTVDWVVLTSGVVGLGLATLAIASGGVENLSTDIRNALANSEVGVQAQDLVESVWGTLPMLSSFADQQEREQWVAGRNLDQGNVQAYYDGLYAKATSGDPLAIDDIGALEAYAQSNGLSIDTGTNQSYAELHAAYTAANG